MDDRAALMAGIVANPDEDTPRLALADWLQEHGDEHDRARAEFIRLQIQAHNLPRREAAGRKQLERSAEKLQRQHSPAWLAPLPFPPGYVSFTRGLLSPLMTTAGVFLKPRHQRALPDALATIGVESVWLTSHTTKAEALTSSAALGWVASLQTSGANDEILCAIGCSPNCAHFNELYLIEPRVTDAGLRSFALTARTARLRCFRLMCTSSRTQLTAEGVLPVLNSSRLPLLSALTLLCTKSFKYERVLRDPGMRRVTHLELFGPVPMSEVIASEHLRELRSLYVRKSVIAETDVDALVTGSNLARLTDFVIEFANEGRPQLSKKSEARLQERFGPTAISYDVNAMPRPR
jgi:uncharacterized protein (TIGR02996 family)